MAVMISNVRCGRAGGEPLRLRHFAYLRSRTRSPLMCSNEKGVYALNIEIRRLSLAHSSLRLQLNPTVPAESMFVICFPFFGCLQQFQLFHFNANFNWLFEVQRLLETYHWPHTTHTSSSKRNVNMYKARAQTNENAPMKLVFGTQSV